ncbi:MAG: hypothetical protein LBN11_07645, partial [Tannerella sp.]|nr:hypothetical protein [Tannerella sp.]
MANKKKIKQQSKPMPKKNSRTEQEQCCIVAKKILRHFELDTKLLDVFTKKQKERLSKVYYITPTISADKPGTVPRQYLKKINSDAYKFMKTNFWGNPENELTFFELATYGLSFLSSIQGMFKEDNLFEQGTPQYESASRICEKFDRDELMNKAFQDVSDHIFYLSRAYSRVNFRMYGHIMDCEKLPDKRCNCGHCFVYKVCYKITAQECETKDFSFNNIYRKAYRMFIPADGLYLPTPLKIPQNTMYKREKEDKVFNMYIQSHVFHRFRERLDIFSPTNHNLLFQYALTRYLKLVQYDKRDLFACLIDDDAPVGYFTFLIRGDDIVVNTFLPLVGENTPEGKKLQELLFLSKEEIVYLGMDKLSFFTKVDFEQIPKLKQALIDSNIWKTKLALEELIDEDETEEKKSSIDMNKTMFVKKFF